MAAADESIGQLLTKLYYQPGGSAAYSSVNRLYKEARKHNPSVTHKIVNQFLAKQYTHTVHRKINRQFPRRKVLSLRIDETWASDLITVNEVLNPIQSNPIQSNPIQSNPISLFFLQLESFNNGYQYILTVICIFSRKLWTRKLKHKSKVEMIQAMQSIVDQNNQVSPYKLWTDSG